MSDLFGNHIVGFHTRRLIYLPLTDPVLYGKIGVYGGIPFFLIFDPKQIVGAR